MIATCWPAALIARGYVVVPEHETADVYIVNTCTVTCQADAKSRKMLRKALRQSGAVVIVTGCAASLDPTQLALVGVAAVVPLTEQARIPELVAHLRPTSPVAMTQRLTASAARTRATVKVQDGCKPALRLLRGDAGTWSGAQPAGGRGDERIASAGRCRHPRDRAHRHPSRCLRPGSGCCAAGRLARRHRSAGHHPPAAEFAGNPSASPRGWQPAWLRTRRSAAIFISACNPATTRYCAPCVAATPPAVTGAPSRCCARRCPTRRFTTDIIVGLPGETDAAFARTCALVEEVGFIKLHIFKYSPRPGTAAAAMRGQVHDALKDDRAHALALLEQRLFQAYGERLLGSEVSVLVERNGKGLTPHYVRVVAPFPPALGGEIVPVRVTAVGDDMLHGTVAWPSRP